MPSNPEFRENPSLESTFRRFRIKLGLTQASVARRAGINRETYSRWETGSRESDLKDHCLILAAGFLYPRLSSEEDQQELLDNLMEYIPKPQILEYRNSLRQQFRSINSLINSIKPSKNTK